MITARFCDPCPPSMFSPGGEGVQCSRCRHMWEVAPKWGMSECTMCSPLSGRPSYPNNDRTACLAVPEGCPPGTQQYPNVPGCVGCSPDTFSTGGSGAICQPCAAGTILPEGRGKSATDCYPDPARWGPGCARSDGTRCVATKCDHATQSVVMWNDNNWECFPRRNGLHCPDGTGLHNWPGGLAALKDERYWRYLIDECVQAGRTRQECTETAGKKVFGDLIDSNTVRWLLSPTACRPCPDGTFPNPRSSNSFSIRPGGTTREIPIVSCPGCSSPEVPFPLPAVCGELTGGFPFRVEQN